MERETGFEPATSSLEAGIWCHAVPRGLIRSRRQCGSWTFLVTAVLSPVLVDSEAFLMDNEACMIASLHLHRFPAAVNSVTNSVTNRLGNEGQCRATVTNSVTKLRAIQGNEITTFGESRATEGN